MKVVILQNFEGYPGKPDEPGTHYVASETAIEVPDEFGALIIKKGHARAADAAADLLPRVTHEAG